MSLFSRKKTTRKIPYDSKDSFIKNLVKFIEYKNEQKEKKEILRIALGNINVSWNDFKQVAKIFNLDDPTKGDLLFLSINPNVTMENVKLNPTLAWDYKQLSTNQNIRWKDIKNNINKPWSRYFLSSNPNLTFENFKEIVDKNYFPEDGHMIDEEGNITHGFNLESLSRHPNITIDIVKEDTTFIWKYDILSMNPNITWNIIKENPQIRWDKKYVSLNPTITFDIVKENPRFGWSYKYLSQNPNIRWEDVKEAPRKNWDYRNLLVNPNITWKIIMENEEFEDYRNDHLISLNPNITWKIVFDNPDLKCWNLSYLAKNPMNRYNDITDIYNGKYGTLYSKEKKKRNTLKIKNSIRNSSIRERVAMKAHHPNALEELLNKGYSIENAERELNRGYGYNKSIRNKNKKD